MLTRCLLLAAIVGVTAAPLRAEPSEETEFFEKRIRPLLVERCYDCHGDVDEPEGGLRLTSREAILIGGDSGPAVVEGKPDESLLIEAVRHDGLKMPPDDKLAKREIEDLLRWVEIGAPWPKAEGAINTPTPAASGIEQAGELSESWKARIEEAKQQHWAFQPVRKPATPQVKDSAWPKNDIDHFILASLEDNGLTPAAPAERAALLRRATFDLVGLPPTPEEVTDFLNDASPDAWEKVVDRLLASPHYGERWARHWLDVARYADTKGYVLFEEPNYPFAYTYRDYVIRSFNEDLPYDRFIVEQLAADKLDLGDDRRALAAMGFLTAGNNFYMNMYDLIDDRIDVVTRGLLGLTVSCARCHDHKFDPIPTRDYYSLYGVMASSVEPVVPPLFEPPPDTDEYRAYAEELAKREKALADYVDKKYSELEASTRTRFAEYLLAAHEARNKPATDEFMLLADTDDLNPVMIGRWETWLARSRIASEPVFLIWHELAALPESEFESEARQVIERLSAPEVAGKVNPIVLKAFIDNPPKTLADAATIYSNVLNNVDAKTDEATSGDDADATLRAARQALRDVFYGDDSPTMLHRTPTGDLSLFPDRPSQGERRKLLQAVEEWRSSGPGAPPRAMALVDRDELYDPRVFARGSPSNPREAVPRQFLHILSDGKPEPFTNGSGRLELAQAIASPANPLTARVFVNRVWMHHFGEGLVRTTSNFGLNGEPPTHPELLDYLAATFMEDGWSIKKLHRRILLSATYQQASDHRPDCFKIDPENRLLWKFPRRRLEFEPLRDSLLFVSGRLDLTLYGPVNDQLESPDATRRTIYSRIDRMNLPGVLRTFDFPNPDSSAAQRAVTTIPQQGLFMMNHPLPLSAAKLLVERSDVVELESIPDRVNRIYMILFGREAKPEELSVAEEFLGKAPDGDLWAKYAHSLLMTNEFTFVD